MSIEKWKKKCKKAKRDEREGSTQNRIENEENVLWLRRKLRIREIEDVGRSERKKKRGTSERKRER